MIEFITSGLLQHYATLYPGGKPEARAKSPNRDGRESTGSPVLSPAYGMSTPSGRTRSFIGSPIPTSTKSAAGIVPATDDAKFKAGSFGPR